VEPAAIQLSTRTSSIQVVAERSFVIRPTGGLSWGLRAALETNTHVNFLPVIGRRGRGGRGEAEGRPRGGRGEADGWPRGGRGEAVEGRRNTGIRWSGISSLRPPPNPPPPPPPTFSQEDRSGRQFQDRWIGVNGKRRGFGNFRLRAAYLHIKWSFPCCTSQFNYSVYHLSCDPAGWLPSAGSLSGSLC